MNFYKTMLLAAPCLIAAGLLLSGVSANAQADEAAGQTYGAAATGDSAKTISWYISHSPFPMSIPVLPVFPDRDFVLTDYGARGDGQTLNTTAFQKALTACSEAGGGRCSRSCRSVADRSYRITQPCQPLPVGRCDGPIYA